MKINYKQLFKYLLITFLIGSLFSVFTIDNSYYKMLIKPIEIPPIVFPIVWSILYILSSISIYIVRYSKEANKIYLLQIITNSLWTLFFFGFKLINFSFIWCLLLLIIVSIMTYYFYKLNKVSGFLNIPYILWLIFASYLNLSILILN